MIKLLTAIALSTGALIANANAQDLTGDAAAGEKVFNRCKACHAVGEGAKNKVGPELNDLFGRKPGSHEDFKYSDAMIAYGEDKVWDVEHLTAYLAAPRKVVKGTKMAFAGLKKEEQIADVLAYLATFDPDGAKTGE
ncbi:cytochrome c family protein [Notoacmeibacter sp. MSK16QG-6]|uniref:c-type cytochrome n=1 Tax=Notoacmeibacter sp. MSK16QG-6 TaxID=2957982 RepID=UPI00209D68F8|nr:cytochrome c family protein [Notoacmeibacter sp. MSK16QG-6]MCP1199034.1 cytochrome c family protein [Notoacmeibacter sp. MSK16QG-6]